MPSPSVPTRAVRVALGAALLAGVAACASPVPSISDPREILAAAVAHLHDAKTVHVELKLDGSLVLGSLIPGLPLGGGTGGAPGSPAPGALPLTGSHAAGDLDRSTGRASLRFAVPALLGLTGEVRQIGAATYLSSTLTSRGWHPLDASSGLPVGALEPLAWLDTLTSWLEAPTSVPIRRDDASCQSGSCYVVRLSLDASAVPGLASAAPGLPSGLAATTVTVDLRVDKASLRLSEAAVTVDLGPGGSLDLGLTFGAWDAAVTIEAPPPDQIVPGPLLP